MQTLCVSFSGALVIHQGEVYAPVAQQDRASVSGTEGRRFESCRVRFEKRGVFKARPEKSRLTAFRQDEKGGAMSRDCLCKQAVSGRCEPGQEAPNIFRDHLLSRWANENIEVT